MLYLNKSKETEGWCLTQQKIHQDQNLENSRRPSLQTLLCPVRCPMELFRWHFTGHCIYIYPAVHMQVWTHDPCFIWSSPKRLKGGVWGSCVGCNSDTCKVYTGFEVTCKLSPKQKAKGPCHCRDRTASFNSREDIVNLTFSEVVTELWGPILPFLEMRKVLEHWGEACPALRYSGLTKSQAHAKPLTLVLQPTI
jgi:hypothetical protein